MRRRLWQFIEYAKLWSTPLELTCDIQEVIVYNGGYDIMDQKRWTSKHAIIPPRQRTSAAALVEAVSTTNDNRHLAPCLSQSCALHMRRCDEPRADARKIKL